MTTGVQDAQPRQDDLAARRRAFLHAVDAEVSAPRSRTHVKRAGALAGLTLAMAASFVSTPGLAQASMSSAGTQQPSAQEPCLNPQPKPESQTFYCGTGQWVYDYMFQRGNCYHFDLWSYLTGCSAGVHHGERVVCA